MVPHTSLALEPVPEDGRYPGLIPRPHLEHLLESFTTRFAAPGKVTDRRLEMHTEIIGLSLDGEDKAYPLELVREQGLILDRVGETSIALVYDGDGNHVGVFDRPVAGLVIDFRLEDGDLIAPDCGQRWDWAGQPHSANTTPLQKLPYERSWWLGRVEFHPQSTVFQADS